MSTIKTTMTADASQLLKTQESIGQSAAKVSAEYREATKEAQRLGTVASRAIRDAQTPLEQYNNKLADYSKLLNEGKLTQEQYNTAVENARNKYETATRSGSVLEGTMKRLVGFAGGFLSVGTAIATVAAAIRDADQAASDASEKLAQSFGTRGELGQVYPSLAEGQKVSDMFLRAGARGQDEANQLAFNIKSAGLLGDIGTYLDVMKLSLINSSGMGEMFKSISGMQTALGAGEVGNTEQLLSKALTASGGSLPRANELLSAVAKAGGEGVMAKLHDEELLATISVLANSFAGDKSMASDRTRAFIGTALSGNVMKGTIAETVAEISKGRDAGKSWKDIFGSDSKEAAQAATLMIQNLPSIVKMTEDLNKANNGQALRDALSAGKADTIQRQGALINLGQAEIDISRRAVGARYGLIKSFADQEYEINERLGDMGMIGPWVMRRLRTLPGFGMQAGIDKGFGTLPTDDEIQSMRNKAVARSDDQLVKQIEVFATTVDELRKWLDSNANAFPRRPAVPAPER